MSWRQLAARLAHDGARSRIGTVLDRTKPLPRSSNRWQTSAAASAAVPCEHDNLHGFRVLRVQEIAELSATAVHLSHETGVQYLHVARDDTNNTFGVGFRTPPADSTGVAHILEHTALCGSERYPTRDPFFKMLNRSLATFMNAFTAADWTMYPFSTCNATDYANLLQVYLDAVFRPRLQRLDFMQEGWRLEHSEPHDAASPLLFKGVVFNEMKGALADRQRLLSERVQRGLLPSHAYGHSSGGEPAAIVQLSWQQLRDFHARHYHPANCYMYSYGDMPVHEHLALINDRYLSHLPAAAATSTDGVPASLVPSEPRWSQSRYQSVSCRPEPLAAHADRPLAVVVSYLLPDVTDVHDRFAAQLLGQLLLDGPCAPFYGALIESGLALDFAAHAAGVDDTARQMWLSVGVQGVRDADRQAVIDAIDATLAKVAGGGGGGVGLDAERVEAVLHQTELALKHQTQGFGLTLLMHSLTPWIHGQEPVDALCVNATLAEFRRRLAAEPQLLQRLVRRWLLDNQHRLVTTMTPDEHHEATAADSEASVVRERAAQLTEEQRRQIYTDGLQLLDVQQHHDDSAAECLPLLAVDDIADEPAAQQCSAGVEVVRVDGRVPVHLHRQPTNGVCYFRALLDVADVPVYLKPLLPLFCQLLTAMGTRHCDYRQLDRRVQASTGGLNASLLVTESATTAGLLREHVLLQSHCLAANTQLMMQLWRELVTAVSFDDTARLRALLQMAATTAADGVVASGHQYAMSHAAASLTVAAGRRDLYAGLQQVRYVRSLAESGDVALLATKLRMLAEMVLVRGGRVRCAVNTTPEAMPQAVDALHELVAEMHVDETPADSASGDGETCPAHEATSRRLHVRLPVPVGFAACSIPTVPYAHEDFAPLRVLARLLSVGHLHSELREKGGAYGGGAACGGGVWSFYSYRDPQPRQSLQLFSSTAEHVRQRRPTAALVHGAQLGVFQSVDAPVVPADRGMRAFLSGISDAVFAEHRRRLKRVTVDDVQRVAAKYLAQPPVSGSCVIGAADEPMGDDWTVSDS